MIYCNDGNYFHTRFHHKNEQMDSFIAEEMEILRKCMEMYIKMETIICSEDTPDQYLQVFSPKYGRAATNKKTT